MTREELMDEVHDLREQNEELNLKHRDISALVAEIIEKSNEIKARAEEIDKML